MRRSSSSPSTSSSAWSASSTGSCCSRTSPRSRERTAGDAPSSAATARRCSPWRCPSGLRSRPSRLPPSGSPSASPREGLRSLRELLLFLARHVDGVLELEQMPLDAEGKMEDRKSTRLNSSHEWISYAVFCLKKKIKVMRRTKCCVLRQKAVPLLLELYSATAYPL